MIREHCTTSSFALDFGDGMVWDIVWYKACAQEMYSLLSEVQVGSLYA